MKIPINTVHTYKTYAVDIHVSVIHVHYTNTTDIEPASSLDWCSSDIYVYVTFMCTLLWVVHCIVVWTVSPFFTYLLSCIILDSISHCCYTMHLFLCVVYMLEKCKVHTYANAYVTQSSAFSIYNINSTSKKFRIPLPLSPHHMP